MKKLIIAEKPSLAKNIANALNVRERKDGYLENEEYIVSWAFGHLYALKDVDDYIGEKTYWNNVKLPFIPKKFEFKVKDDPGIKKQIRILKELINRSDVQSVVNCGDADREGQVIIDIIVKSLQKNNKDILRLWLPEQTEESIKKQVKDMKSNREYTNLFNEGLARTYIDWLFGINLTRFVTINSGTLYPCGRVLIPIVKYINDRDLSIEKFIPEKYYQAESTSSINGVTLNLISKEKFNKDQKEEANQYAMKLNGSKSIVIAVEEKEYVKSPPKLFSLSKLQSLLSKNFKMSFLDSLKVIQKLYENGYITYPRTNTEYLAENEKDKVIDIINAMDNSSILELKDTKKIFDNKKIESHSAITPTTKIATNLSGNEKIVYDAVVSRFKSNFCKEDCIMLKKTIKIKVGDEEFSVNGESIKQKGFLQFEQVIKDSLVPDLKEGEEIKVNFEAKEKITTPPNKINESSLATYLKSPFKKDKDENLDEDDTEEYKNIMKGIEIGTEATRTGIIENAKKYGYIEQKGSVYSITEKGKKFIEILELLGIDLFSKRTVEFSIMQKEVYKKERSIDSIIEVVSKELESIVDNNKGRDLSNFKDNKKDSEIIGMCPSCGGQIIENRKAFGCSNWKDGCKFAIWKEIAGKKLNKKDVKALIANKETNTISGFKSKKGTTFSAKLILNKDNKIEFKF